VHRRRWAVTFVLVAVGVVWIGQGTGLLRGSSFMVDDVRWAVIGAVVALAGIVVAFRELRHGA
jgi:hypothetical protein